MEDQKQDLLKEEIFQFSSVDFYINHILHVQFAKMEPYAVN